MFKKATTISDIKKSQQKCIDIKKDTPTRLRHLRAVLETGDAAELKLFLESNYSPVFQLFYESFINAEINFKQKGAFAAQRSHREELDCCLWILDKILCYLPELLNRRWQSNTLTQIFRKLLHSGNSMRLRKEGMRLFLLWYMVVGKNVTTDMECLFASLLPSFPAPPPSANELGLKGTKMNQIEVCAIIPPSSTEKGPAEQASDMLNCMLDFMGSQPRRIHWREKGHAPGCFSFLLNSFREVYLPYIFPGFDPQRTIYKPSLDLPELRLSGDQSIYGLCQGVLVDWVRKHIGVKSDEEIKKMPNQNSDPHDPGSDQDSISSAFSPNEDVNTPEDNRMVREVLFSTRNNIDFIHETFRQALRLSFRHSQWMHQVIRCYCNWIKMENPQDLPPFMLEPDAPTLSSIESLDSGAKRRNDSYLGAIDGQTFVQAGLQNVLQVFLTSASNVFLLTVSAEYPRLLDEQVELCKLVLNIYRFMVMNTRMEQKTWEQLLVILFHITSQTLSAKPPKHKNDSLGRRFAAALFQTLIVSWIKANLSVVICGELWDQLLSTLVSLTHWEELIKEWAKTMDTLTKVLARHVYGLELNNLPLDRLTERKAIKRQGIKQTGLESARGTLTRAWTADPKIRTPRNQSQSIVENRLGGSEGFTSGGVHMGNHGSESHHHHSHVYDRSPMINKARRGSQSSSNQASLTNYDQEYHSHCSHVHGSNSAHIYHSYHYRKRLYRSYSDSAIGSRDFCSECHSRYILSRSVGCLPLGSEYDSRSPSPCPSSGVECSSLKESPLQMDFGGDTASIDTLECGVSAEQRSVMGGGTVRGWLPDVSVVLWRRVLGLLGDPNLVQTPQMHQSIFNYLLDLVDTLIKLSNNQSISVDNQTTPDPPELVPPISILAPWCFKALSLPPSYHRGKNLALKLLCKMIVRRASDLQIQRDLLSCFYRTLHQGLVGNDKETVATLIEGCGPSMFSLELPGSSMLALDFIYAASIIVSESDRKVSLPRVEAISLLGSLYPIASQNQSMPVLQPSQNNFTLINCIEVKDHILDVLLKSGRRDPHWRSRCLSLCALGISVCHELSRQDYKPKVIEALNVIMAALKIGVIVGQVASTLLLGLTDFSDVLLSKYPSIPSKIVQVLCQTLASIYSNGNSSNFVSHGMAQRHLALSLLFTLGEWVMKLPMEYLFETEENGPLLHMIFKVLHNLSSGNPCGKLILPGMKIETMEVDSVMEDDPPKNSTIKRGQLRPGIDSSVTLAAKSLSSHLVNHLGHFPLGIGAHRLSSLVVETDDLPVQECSTPSTTLLGELSQDLFLSPRVQLFALNGSCLLSMVQLSALNEPGGAAAIGFKTPRNQVRLILRDLSGKFSWDASTLYAPPSPLDNYNDDNVSLNSDVDLEGGQVVAPSNQGQATTLSNPSIDASLTVVTVPPRHTIRHRPTGTLPSIDDSAEDMDNLDDLLVYLCHTSPEALLCHYHPPSGGSFDPPLSLPLPLQHEAMTTLLNQRNCEKDYVARQLSDQNMVCPRCSRPCPPNSSENNHATFQECRKLFDQLGLSSFEKRPNIQMLLKNDRLVREIRNMDNQKCRETHKIAIIYVSFGQEDKMSILGNTAGSDGFEEFVAGMGWEVELGSHSGFMGGLQKNGSTGETAPYYATSLVEAIFHVSTRMPSHSEESMLQKVRHLGNDEIHIVWSEHSRDYRRGIIPTEFCDVLIVIYPMSEKLFRIQIQTKPEVPLFGPLFDGSVVEKSILPQLIRSTAINASKAKRSTMPMYTHFFEERQRSLETIIQNHSEPTTFEKFISEVFCPSIADHSMRRGGQQSNKAMSTVTSALLDGQSNSANRPPITRPTSYSVGEHHNVRERVRSALGSESSILSNSSTSSQDVCGNSGPSPRGNKKMSFKAPRKIGMSSTGSNLHPLSPPPLSTSLSPQPPPRRHREGGPLGMPPLPRGK